MINLANNFQNKDYVSKELFEQLLTNFSKEEQRQVIKDVEEHNLKVYKEKLQKIKSHHQERSDGPKRREEISLTNSPQKRPKEKLDISFYEQLLRSCPNPNELEQYLPKRKNSDFFLIMNLLMSGILKEIVEMQRFVTEEQMEESLQAEFYKEIKEKQNFLTALGRIRDQKEQTEENLEEKTENTILYLQSPGGTYYALSEVRKDIDTEFYASILELFQSIKDGTFKNIKMFSDNEKINGLLEVKNHQTRIVFKRLNHNTYIILGMFIKKVDVDRKYHLYLANRNDWLQKEMPTIIQSLEDLNYLQENQAVSAKLERILKKEEN